LIPIVRGNTVSIGQFRQRRIDRLEGWRMHGGSLK
jgi:hypothetical protein